MSAPRVRAWPLLVVALAIVAAIPATMQAQFGGLNKLLDKAKAKVDSTKASVDTAQVVTDSTKATINGAANLTRNGKNTTTATTKTAASGTTQANGSKGGKGAANTATAGATLPASKSITITETVYGQFTRGFAVEKALRKATPNDPSGALNTGVTTSGLSQTDYAMVRAKITVYQAFAASNTKVNTPLLSADEVAVLDAHKSDIVQLMGP